MAAGDEGGTFSDAADRGDREDRGDEGGKLPDEGGKLPDEGGKLPDEGDELPDEGGAPSDGPAVTQPPPREAARVEGSARASLGAPGGQLVGWAALALVNAVLIAVAATPARFGVRLLHHLYDAGQLLAVGWISYWLVLAADRARLARRWMRFGALFVVALGVALALLADDLTGFAQRRAAAGSKLPWRLLVSIGVAAALTGTAALGALLARARWRWIAVAVALASGTANHFVLRSGYPGVHFFVAWFSAILLGTSIAGVTLPRVRLPTGRRSLAIRIVATAAALVTVVVRPTEAAWAALYWSPSAVVAPVLARLGPARARGTGPHFYEGSPWFRDRTGLPDVPPHLPKLAGENGIVVFVTVDALRADLVAKDELASKLPALHALRQQAAYFSVARAPTPSTVTTIVSVLTGKYYSQLYWTELPDGPFKGALMPHEDPSPRLPQLLQPAGVGSVQVIGLYGLGADVGVGVGAEEIRASRDYAHAREVMRLAIERLKKAGDAPLFMFMHFVDPHAPYDLAGKHGTAFERYLREVALVDEEIGRLVEFLDKSGLAARTTLIVAADHGEAFGEHNLSYHASSLYDELMRVPLLVRGPSVKPRRIDEPVTLMDLGPTVLDMFGVATPAWFMGESLVPLLRGESMRFTRPIAGDAGRRMQAMVFPDGFKVVTDLNKKTLELYELHGDPAESRNLVDELGRAAGRYTGALHAFFREHTLRRPGYVPPWRQF